MLALGIICLLLAAALVIGVLITSTSQEILFTSTVGDLTTNPAWVFVAGAVAMALALLGLSFFGRGTRHKVVRRKEMKRLRKVEAEQGTGAVPTTSAEPATGARDGYDEPDRELVREPRQTRESRAPREPATDLTATERPATAAPEDPARHREG